MARILLVDDEEAIRTTLTGILERQGHQVFSAGSVAEAEESLLSDAEPDVALVDLRLPDGEGTEVLHWISSRDMPLAVVMISGHGTIPAAVGAVKEGAFDFLEKPLDRERLLITIRNAAMQTALRRKALDPSRAVDLLTRSPSMEPLLAEAGKLAPADVPLLISGETGSGKEVLARWIHERSRRNTGAFVALNCAALPDSLAESELFGHSKGAFTDARTKRKGKFLAAHGGTLFLDEIGDLSPAVQAKLLRVLEDGAVEPVGADVPVSVDVRIIAASHRDLQALADGGNFRRDLLFRISGFPLSIPPLRSRPEDIPLLANHFFQRARSRQGWEPASLPEPVEQALLDHSWPGNVRELRWAVERAALLAGPGLPEARHLPASFGTMEGEALTTPRRQALQGAEIKAIQDALATTGGNVSRAASLLGMSRSRLYDRLKDFGIDPGAYRERPAGR